MGAMQGNAPDMHSPLWHCSTPVQKRPSSQPATPGPSGRFGLLQPVTALQVSGPVHGLSSLQLSAVPGVGLQTALAQVPIVSLFADGRRLLTPACEQRGTDLRLDVARESFDSFDLN